MLSRISKLNRMFSGKMRKELGSGIYVDVENLQGVAKEVIQSLLESWPSQAPRPSLLSVYVPADKVELWRMWAQEHLPEINFLPKDIQHFTAKPGKNSADIALAVDAISDFLDGKINYVVVVSNDSDFISLYAKIRQEQRRIGYAQGRVPFLWVLNKRSPNYTSSIKEFSLEKYIHFVDFGRKPNGSVEEIQANPSPGKRNSKIQAPASYEDLAEAIIRERQANQVFGYPACKKIIRKLFEHHEMAKSDEKSFKREFDQKLWPILSSRGVERSGKDSSQFKMTQKAKDSLQ